MSTSPKNIFKQLIRQELPKYFPVNHPFLTEENLEDIFKQAQLEQFKNIKVGENLMIAGDIIQKIVQNIVLPPPPLPTGIPHNITYSGVHQFVGRALKLERLHQELSDCERFAITAIAGMGGIGKTELALQYALRYQDSYPGGLCWLQVRGKELATQIIDFGRERINLNPSEDLDLQRQVQYCWAHWKEGTALIVLDDILDYGNYYRENILPYLPPAQPRFKVLMTSRQSPEVGFRRIDLDVLSPDAALNLLRVVVGKEERIEAELKAAEALCKWLGYLPLGLELVGRYLYNHPTLTLGKVQQRLESKRLEARALLQKEYGNMTAQLGVAAAFELTWVELDYEAQQLGCLSSLFAPVGFDSELVEKCLPETDSEDLGEILDCCLLKFNLLQLTPQNIYRLHPLVREFLQRKLGELETNSDLKQAFVSAMVGIAEQIHHYQILTREHIDALKEHIPHLEEIAKNLAETIGNKDLIRVFTGLTWFYSGQGIYDLAEAWCNRGLSAVKKRLGEEHLDVAQNLNNLANIYHERGRYNEAETAYRKALELYKRLRIEEHPDLALSLNGLALVCHSLRRYDEAESFCQRALEMRKRLLGEENNDIAQSLNNLALVYHSLRRYDEAESFYQQALEMRKRLLDEEQRPLVAISLDNLAVLYESRGRYDEAEPLYQQALEMRKCLLGEEHPLVANSLNNLATLYKSQGRYKQAEPLYQQALKMRKCFLREEHPLVAISLDNLAALYKSQGRYDEAEPLYQQALEMRKRLLDEEQHPSVAISLDNLATLYKSQGRYDEAEPLYQQALEAIKRLPSEDPFLLATTLNNLAILYERQRKYEQAEPLFQQALKMKKRLLSEEHRSVATTLNSLGFLYHSQGRYDEAEPLYQQALKMRKRLLGEEHLSVAISLDNLAELYCSQERYEQAEPMFQQALEIKKRFLDEEQHPLVANTLNKLAKLYHVQKRDAKAEPLLQEALKIRKRFLGEEHPLVANTLNDLADLS